MALNQSVILSAQKTALQGEILTLGVKLRDIYDQIKDIEDNRAIKIEEAREEFLAAARMEIDGKYHESVLFLETEIREIDDYINSVVIEDDHEDLSEAMQKRETLNKASIRITEFYNQLLRTSQKEFIDLAITDGTLSLNVFRKHLKKLDSYILHLTEIEKLYVIIEKNPELIVSNLLTSKDEEEDVEETSTDTVVKNIVYYIRGFWLGPIQIVTFVFKLVRTVKRVRDLHMYSKLYHLLVRTIFQIQEENNSVIQEVFVNLLDNVRNSKLDTRKERENELNELNALIDREKKSIFFTTDSLEKEIAKNLYNLQQLHEEIEKELKFKQDELNDVDQKLRSNYERTMTQAQKERDQFMNPRNEIRHVVLPPNLIWDVKETSNIYFPILPGLYVYISRESTTKFLKLFVYQLRNYMKWGSVKFHILDKMKASWINRFLLPDESNSDMILTDMTRDFKEEICVIHDALDRRLKSILNNFNNIAEYNTVQAELESEPFPYLFLVQFLEDDQKFNDEMVHLFVTGEKVGVVPMVFIKRDDLTSAALKIYERYVENVIELTQTGLTTLPSSIFRQNFEKELEEKQNNFIR